MTTSCKTNASCFFILLFLVLFLTDIDLIILCTTLMSDKLGNQVDITIVSIFDEHHPELASCDFIL